jgi:hypothetical protein
MVIPPICVRDKERPLSAVGGLLPPHLKEPSERWSWKTQPSSLPSFFPSLRSEGVGVSVR